MIIRRKKGFTLIELLIVIAIVAILSAVILSSIGSYRMKARDAQRKSALRQLAIALELYRERNGVYPTTGGNWYASEPTASGYRADWIPNINPNPFVPTYFGQLPRDPAGGSSSLSGCAGQVMTYRYRSNPFGDGYDLLSYCAAENTPAASDPFYDPNHSTSWEVCVGSDCSDI